MEDQKQPVNNQNAEEAELSEADRQYVALAEELIKKYRLEANKRIGFLKMGSNVGDSYFLIAALTYAQTVLNKKYVIIAPESAPIQVFAGWHKSNGAEIEQAVITLEQEEILISGSPKIKRSYANTLDYYTGVYNKDLMRNTTLRKDVYDHLTRPRFRVFDAEKYICQFGIVPGKTVFVIPDSVYNGTMPLYFWTMSIELFRLLGYKVIVNAREGTKIYGDVTCFLPPLDDIVGLCDLCGTVYAVRSGLAEVLASEVHAKFFCFGILSSAKSSGLRSVMQMYPFIDNQDHHIVEIPTPAKKEEFYWIKSAADILQETRGFMRENIRIRDRINPIQSSDTANRLAKPYFYCYHPANQHFVDVRWLRVAPFCTVHYSFSRAADDSLSLLLEINPPMEYEIHIALKDISAKRFVNRCEYYNHTAAFFKPENDGRYCASVHIRHPETLNNCWFETEPLQLIRPAKERVHLCTDYQKYVQFLEELKENAVILITSRDAHTNSAQTRRLALDALHISADLTHMFRHSWLCVIDGGNVVRELTNPDQEVRTTYEWDGNKAELTSAGYNVNHNNKTPVSIKINGKEEAVNRRGLNFVVWDKQENCLLDSVCFDTYLDMKAYRRN